MAVAFCDCPAAPKFQSGTLNRWIHPGKLILRDIHLQARAVKSILKAKPEPKAPEKPKKIKIEFPRRARMDQDTRYALANVYRQLRIIGRQVYATQERLLRVQRDLLTVAPAYRQMTKPDQLDRDIAEIGLTIAAFETSIEAVIGGLTDFSDSDDLT
jgi:hypothetical protein